MVMVDDVSAEFSQKDQMLSFEILGIKAVKIKRDLPSLEGIEIAFVRRERPLQAGKLFPVVIYSYK